MENIETLLAAVAQTTGFGDEEPVVATPSELGLESSGSPAGDEVAGVVQPSPVVGGVVSDLMAAAPTPVSANGTGEKRKRGRPPKGQLTAKPPPIKRVKVEDEEEDVCFICFDGGSLVLCDRKGCPKAYHPACIKRDEAFFKSKAKWNCGWHICSGCRKTSHYMCYTCTYSLCKGCTKDADFVSVRGNKGFCSTCMKTIMLIENKDQAANDSIQVDFDDKLSWEYLFKMYWVILKENLSLTLSELTQAKRPWKGVAAVTRKSRLNNAIPSAVGGDISMSYKNTEHLELNKPHVEMVQNDALQTSLSSNGNHVEKLNDDTGEHVPTYSKETVKPNVSDEISIAKATDKPDIKEGVHEPCIKKDLDDPCIVKDTYKPCIGNNTNSIETDRPAIHSTEWASKDLLEFVKHMRNGDTSALSQFDVQTLLIDYVKRNNLWDPHQKSQIVCDQRLKNLFGKPRVDQVEMLKLLEFHFLVKEDTLKNLSIPARAVRSTANNLDADGKVNALPVPSNSRKRKMRKKNESGVAQLDLNEYAAIDVHNINLIYLRRNLMESLTENRESFNDKVIGSIVRIKISADDQKPEVHRLVQVIGTSKAAEPYKIGNKTADVMLEVLNLDRKEVVSVDAISNEEFTEDECKWLRQSIRCGLVKQFTVDEVKKKASALQSVRVDDWLEAEILRLNHLRVGRKGIKKELRKNADRLKLLKSPEERQRRISEVPEIHADPTMNPNYESEEDIRSSDHSKKDDYAGPSYSPFPRTDWESISSNNRGKEEHSVEVQAIIMEKTDASVSNDWEKHTNQIDIDSSPSGGKNDQAMERSQLETSTAIASIGNSQPADNIETEKLWHYRDPNSKIQGPFSMMQLRKCNTTGLFPHDMRIWTNHEQYDSLLLTDALNGKLYAAPDMSHKASSSSQENGPTGGVVLSEGTNVTTGDAKQTEMTGCSSSGVLPDTVARPVKADESGSSGWPRCWDLLKDGNPSADGVQIRDLLPPSNPETRDEHLTDRGRESDELLTSPNGEKNAAGPTQNPMPSGEELRTQPKDDDRKSSEGNLRSLNIDLSSTILEPVPVLAPVSKSPVSSKQAENIDVLDLLSPTSKTENQQSVSADIPAQGSSFLELLSPAPRSNNEDQAAPETDIKHSGFMNLPMPNSGPGWIGASSLGIGGVQLPDVADEWCGYSQTPARPPIQEWDSGLVSASASRPPEVTGENADATAPDAHHLTHASSSHPPSNGPNWLAIMNEPIEFVALGEDSVSDLLAEVDAMESRGALPSPTSAIKFARELLEDCKDDCFSSIEDFSPTPELRKSDALSSTSDVHLTSQSSAPCRQNGMSPVDAFDFFRRPSVNSSASSEGETSAPVHSGDAGSEFHPGAAPNNSIQEMVGAGAAMVPGPGSDATDPGWGQMQGNINLVTVQGNVNLVLGGPAAQGMANLGWGANQAPNWANPNSIRSPRNGSLPWDGQRKYGGERFNCPREWGGYQGSEPGFGGGRGRPPWGRQSYGGGGGYSRPLPKGQRVCKFYESGRCKKGAFCDYLHP
ncbi:zinc finger CCCH domain-containing protein 44-like [Salvia miltiorrhiza]|uniref:zinc finger CCCH domain-containing protein 44-like n=1 Tax=Salvia miltiorrhiza TaxID=226208 RepID=UPI0025AC74D5|nr:zinc finger CCCH domain-containing protein 44-like [Salvia miltiorrhiza]